MRRFMSVIVQHCLICLLSFPLQAAPFLVEDTWLSEHLNDPDLVVVDMSSEDMQYQRFHIPGAVWLPYRAINFKQKDGVTLRVTDERLFKILGFLGITADKHVVIYDDMGGLNAARLFWELEKIGHKQVSILDGGLVQWILEGRHVDNRAVEPDRVTYKPTGSGRRNNAEYQTVLAALTKSEILLLDVRTPEEYQGDPRQKRSGHIPGAKLWPWDQAVNFKKGFVVQDEDKLLASLKKLGADSSKPVIAYCRTGHRASRTYFTLRRLGFEDVRLYDGSIAEWSINRGAPLKMGKHP